MQTWECCIVEWLWNQNSIAVYLPDGTENKYSGSYVDVARMLSQLGTQGWEVVSCAGTGNWLLWTLKRPGH